jgi:flavin reductase (DIM6/NTAB) family NADH-FMN oxidoreductase RutF
VVEVGDRWMVIGQVLELHSGIPPHHPLLFHSRHYRHLNFAESSAAPDLSDVEEEPAHIYYD